ncbi:MAG: phage tail tube protein [Candidatus Bathyarchaeia archaeon]
MGLIGRLGVVKKGTATIGSVKNVSISLSADLIKEYVLGDDKPDTLASGNKTFSISIEKLYVDKTFAEDVLNGTPVTIEVYPKGVGTNKPKITLSDVVLNSWDFEMAQDGVIGESVSGEAKSIEFGTQS